MVFKLLEKRIPESLQTALTSQLFIEFSTNIKCKEILLQCRVESEITEELTTSIDDMYL